ncbi:hypothetical protein CAEBREN_03575 [Caenorhabditis brenneri]|uniref:Uncharacterized protein n=1 Tax=Caenorhabditis brenneri TaxID=135651 RepID=G0N0J4_CAEBE|nr:hypothetical protein CAEBREN_03575 [Caenorhabditis brenneri]
MDPETGTKRKLQKKTGESNVSIRGWIPNQRNRIRRRGVKQSQGENDRSPSRASSPSIMNAEVDEESEDLTNLRIDQNSEDVLDNVDASLTSNSYSVLQMMTFRTSKVVEEEKLRIDR